jgi:hypothetical protein
MTLQHDLLQGLCYFSAFEYGQLPRRAGQSAIDTQKPLFLRSSAFDFSVRCHS